MVDSLEKNVNTSGIVDDCESGQYSYRMNDDHIEWFEDKEKTEDTIEYKTDEETRESFVKSYINYS